MNLERSLIGGFCLASQENAKPSDPRHRSARIYGHSRSSRLEGNNFTLSVYQAGCERTLH